MNHPTADRHPPRLARPAAKKAHAAALAAALGICSLPAAHAQSAGDEQPADGTQATPTQRDTPTRGEADAGAEPAEFTNPAANQALNRLEQRRSAGVTVYSRAASEDNLYDRDIAAASTDDLPPRQAGLIREGAFLVERQGILRPLENGLWAFVFDAPLGERAPEAMVMQPGTTLEEMTRLVSLSDEIITFRVSGEVFAYQGRNYLLPGFFAVVGEARPESGETQTGEESTDPAGGREEADDAAKAREGTGEGAGKGADAGEAVWERLLADGEARAAAGEGDAGGPGDADEVDLLLEQLRERAREASGAGRPRRGGGGAAGGGLGGDSGRSGLLREGTLLGGVSGRLERAGEGWSFVTDRDTDIASGELGPIRLMPGLILSGMEAAAARYGESVRLSVSGRVFVYRGRNYLLPTLFVVALDRTGNLVSGQ